MADTEGAAPTSFLRKKVGGIPVLYIAGIIVLILAVYAYRMKKSQAPVDTGASTGTDASTDTGTLPDNLTSTGGFVANPTPTPAPDTTGNSAITDNDTWLRKSVEYLISTGTSAGDAQLALQTWLNGDQLSYEQGVLRDKAVRQFGMPPETFQTGGTTKQGDPPAKVQGPLPRNHIVQGANDNTYAKLANLYYHSGANPDAINLIKAANTPQAPWGNSDTIPKGGSVSIPVWHTPKYVVATNNMHTLRQISSKNGSNDNDILALNPGLKFPVNPGTRVRVR